MLAAATDAATDSTPLLPHRCANASAGGAVAEEASIGTAPLAAENIFTVLAAQLLAVYDRPANDPQLPAAFPAAYTVVKLDAQAGSTIRLSSDGQRLKFTYPGSFLKPDVTFSIK